MDYLLLLLNGNALVGPHEWLDKAECIERAQVEHLHRRDTGANNCKHVWSSYIFGKVYKLLKRAVSDAGRNRRSHDRQIFRKSEL
jgi:hypothetical protein